MRTLSRLGIVLSCLLATLATVFGQETQCVWLQASATTQAILVDVRCDGGISSLVIIANESVLETTKTGEQDAAIGWFASDAKAGDTVLIEVQPVSSNRETVTLIVSDVDATAESRSMVPIQADYAGCGVSPPRFSLGERIRVPGGGSDAILRKTASTQSAFLGTVSVGAVFAVLDGPKCGENAAWYQVEYKGQTGWIAAKYGGILHLEKVKQS